MSIDKKPHKEVLGRPVVTKEGKKLGIIKDVTFETRTGELIHIVIKDPTPYSRQLNLERSKDGEILVSYNAIIAIGDFIVVSEEDLMWNSKIAFNKSKLKQILSKDNIKKNILLEYLNMLQKLYHWHQVSDKAHWILGEYLPS